MIGGIPTIFNSNMFLYHHQDVGALVGEREVTKPIEKN